MSQSDTVPGVPVPWDPRYSFIGDDEVDALLEEYPQLRLDPDKYCPTCQKRGKYKWKGQEVECQCDYQLALHKHYLHAGIGLQYQRLSWEDYYGSEEARDFAQRYARDFTDFIARGVGLILFGGYGTGKTMVANLLLKDLVKAGCRGVYGTTFAAMIDMFTASWRSEREKERFHRRVVRSNILLLDDVGKELKTRNALPESTFDSVLRRRVQGSLPTIITTNMTLEELERGYGGAIFSLLKETSIAIHVKGEDFRAIANERLKSELLSGETRPIV